LILAPAALAYICHRKPPTTSAQS